jgi:drug/metabolite transporter (DMT)-like permease
MKQPLVHLALFAVALIYAIFFSWARDIMPRYLRPEGFIVIRIGAAAVLYWLAHSLLIRQPFNFRQDGRLLFFCALTGVAANMLMFFKGMSITTPINGSVLMLFTPVFVVVIDHLKRRKWPNMALSIGILVACFGAVLLMGGEGFQFGGATVVGDIWVTLNAISYAIYLVLVKGLVNRYHAVTVNKWSFTLGTLFVLPFGLPQLAETNFQVIPWDVWLKIAYVLVFTTFITYQLNAYAIKRASASLAGTYIYLQPVLASLIASLSGRDALTGAKVLFILLIFTGVYLVVFQGNTAQKQKDERTS